METGGGIRTHDLRVMSLTSYHCSAQRCTVKVQNQSIGSSSSQKSYVPYFGEVHHLGHAFLAVAPSAFRFGAIIADGVRGEREKQLPSAIRAGIAFHREIDLRTDRHLAFRRARVLLRPTFGRYAGVFLDLWLDAALGENWSLLSADPLASFLSDIQTAICTHRKHGPPSWQGFFEAATQTDLLYQFASYEGMCAHMVTFIERRRLPVSPQVAVHAFRSFQSELEPLLLQFWREALAWRRTYELP